MNRSRKGAEHFVISYCRCAVVRECKKKESNEDDVENEHSIVVDYMVMLLLVFCWLTTTTKQAREKFYLQVIKYIYIKYILMAMFSFCTLHKYFFRSLLEDVKNSTYLDDDTHKYQ